jgi:hypothetical protein
MRETVFDLYTERDALPWYLRVVALVASWLALAGYIIFAFIFTSRESNVKLSRTALTVLGSTFLAVGYGVSVATAVYSRSLLFLHDAVLVPILTTSFMGLVVTVLNHALHKHFPVPTKVYIYVPLVTAAATTVASACLLFVTYRKLAKIKRLDRQRRKHVQRWDRASSSVSYGDAASTTELLPIAPTLPEDEAQRRQLLRLLLNREAAKSPTLTPPAAPSTYHHIFLPGDPGYDGSQVPSPAPRPRSGSLPGSGSKWNFMSKMTRDPGPMLENFKNPRQRRREEIERSSVLLTPGGEGGWAQTSGTSPHAQSQTRVGMARYA